ncbi:GNAT family N-acetyltransferase [Ponticaulis koreensis]|uniref:GNAT family N-acetyltransferase n=1 Tax=Ponticaulis koreensis TaxID=1123045 RepID=UPI0003B5480F|nr:GNAT family N-acetyltransferase [Ponticaulis koreensis]
MMSQLDIRPVGAEDKPVWEKLWTDYLIFYKSELPQSVYDATFARLLTDELYDPHGLIAWQGDTTIGLTHFMRQRHCWRPEDVIYLQDLYVNPDARGTGAGRALIQAVYDAGDAMGCPTVYWMTENDNHTAMKLYDRMAKQTKFIKYQR